MDDHPQSGGRGAVSTEADGVREAHHRFGGIDVPAALAGMLAGLGLTVVLAGIAGAVGSIGYQRGADTDELSIGGLVTGLVVLFLSFLVGGWVAGRMARYDGARNGILAAVLFLVLAAGLSGLGAWADDRYDFFEDVRLPSWFSDADTTAAVLSAVLGAIVMLGAAALGGWAGSRYHRRADALIAHARQGGAVGDGGTVRGDTDHTWVETSESTTRDRLGR